MIIFYERVSSSDKNKDKRLELAKKNKAKKIFVDVGVKRTELRKVLDSICVGDTLMCESINSIAYGVDDLISIIIILNEKGASFISLEEKIDTNSASGKNLVKLFYAMTKNTINAPKLKLARVGETEPEQPDKFCLSDIYKYCK